MLYISRNTLSFIEIIILSKEHDNIILLYIKYYKYWDITYLSL